MHLICRSCVQYFVHSIVNATMQPGVYITFTDDREGVPCEHPEVQPDLDMSNESLADLQFATQEAGQYLATVLAQNNRTCWDCLGGTRGQQAPPRDAAACAVLARGRQPATPSTACLSAASTHPTWPPSRARRA